MWSEGSSFLPRKAEFRRADEVFAEAPEPFAAGSAYIYVHVLYLPLSFGVKADAPGYPVHGHGTSISYYSQFLNNRCEYIKEGI